MPSHLLLIEYINKFNSVNELKNKCLVEIGSTREIVPDQNSSEHFVKLCKKYNMHFISIDMDPECSNNVKNVCIKYNFTDYEIYTMKGEDFLKSYTNKIDFIYLDAFDFWHDHHTEKRYESYKKYMNCTITNELCYKMHLECCEHLINNNLLNKNSIICLDDILDINATRGKGVLSVPYLLKNDMKCLIWKRNGMIFMPSNM
tara:strand:- start:179 stop:784 length:606 start_codon:yes stop_codon:yes gene_type:complete